MLKVLASRIMPRTTLNLASSVLRELKRRQRKDPRPLGDIASELLARILRVESPPTQPFTWVAKPMGLSVDLEDKDEVERRLASGR